MQIYQKLKPFPLGAIRAEGFLNEQLLRNKDGMGGHLDELEPGMIADPFVAKSYVKRWGDGDQSGWGAEISGNYWTGLVKLAYTLQDAELITKAENWVNAMMKNQREDGYLGTYYEPDAKIYEDYNAWGTSCGMKALLAFYEATGRKDVLDAVCRCMLWFCENWKGDRKTSYAGSVIIEVMVACYHYTGEERFKIFAEEYEDYLCRHDLFEQSYQSLLKPELRYNSNHTAGYGTAIRQPAMLYTVTGKEEYLKATENAIRKLRKKAVHLSGAPVSVNEYIGPVSSTAEAEYCNFRVFNETYAAMSYITGDAKYGDYMEEMFYNAAQGARKKDEKAIAYLSAPNQIYANSNSSSAYWDMQVYAPCYTVSCCPVNSVAVLPEFIMGMFTRDDGDNVYAMAYGPCSLSFGDIKIEEKTEYPFRDTVAFVMGADYRFALNLKIPSWCKQYEIRVNGERAEGTPDADGFVSVLRDWKTGDTVTLWMKMDIEVLRVDDSDACKKYPIAIRRGVLLYSLPIPEKWEAFEGSTETPLPEGWYWYNVNPVFEEADVYDPHEQLGLRRYQTSWNVALPETLTAEEIRVEEFDAAGYVWETPKIKLHLTGYRAPYLCAPYPARTFEPFEDRQPVTDEMELTLVPYGCTNLRITYFPIADLK